MTDKPPIEPSAESVAKDTANTPEQATNTKKVTTPEWSEEKDETTWERDLLNRLAFASLNEQRRGRRWSIFFKLLIAAYFVFVTVAFMIIPMMDKLDTTAGGTGKHTALIEVNGVIAAGGEASADVIVTGLRNAFEDKNTAGVILRINSPGGSPVQSGYVYDEIKRLRKKHPDIKVYAVISDLGASGGYYIAAAADEIYADQASIVGSIGVVMNGFGFVDVLKKLGIERRLLTAGESKGFLDPFSPMKEEELAHIKTLLNSIHQQFITAVKNGRGDRLKVDEHPELFSGLFWTGEQAKELGLVDGLGSSSFVAREIIKAEDIADFTPKANYVDRLVERFGANAAQGMINQLQSQQLSQTTNTTQLK